MQLVFIHGWGFDARFWDALAALLPSYKQHRVDIGFYGHPSAMPAMDEPAVLIGHSLGFVHGVRQRQDWHRWIAVNSFARFVRTETMPGCVSDAELREMRIALGRNTTKALEAFYEKVEAHPPEGSPDEARLRDGLDELRDTDLKNILEPLETPGLLLAARNDPLVPPKTSSSLCGLVQNGTLKWHETGGHMLPVRDPEWCARAIEGFLA